MTKIKKIENLIKQGSVYVPDPSKRAFKTNKGEYAEKDIFLDVPNPHIRNIVKQYKDNISYEEIQHFIQSEIHEYRLFAVLILVKKYKKENKKVYDFYLKNIEYINNWDIIDITTPHIIGNYILKNKNQRKKITNLSKNKNLWKRRISILSTFPQIKQKEFTMALNIIEELLKDKEDLIHKATGWALREIYKKDQKTCETFIKKTLHKHTTNNPKIRNREDA